MLKLNQRASDPRWIEIGPAVRVQVRPITVPMMIEARNASAEAHRGDDSGTAAQIAMVGSLAQDAIVAWEGVGDVDGNPVEPSPERIDQLLALWPAFDAIWTEYVLPALELDAEKNVSEPSPNGTSAAAPTIAAPAPASVPAALT